MSSEIAIQVSNLSKSFRVYARPQDRLKQSLWGACARALPAKFRARARAKAEQCGHNFPALQNINLTIGRGETVGIVGRNGSGKSTLLQLICGTLTPTEGSVIVKGRVAALLELGAGFNPEFTGRENVYLNGQLLGLTREQIQARFEQIASFADIGDFIDQPVKSYSSGMYVRLAFAVIAHVDADILIIDEALAVGDAYFTQKCMRFLNSFMEKGTVLFVSHDMASVKALAKRSVWLDKGALKMEADTKIVADHYLQALYGATQEIAAASQPVPPVSHEPQEAAPVLQQEDFRLPELEHKDLANQLQLNPFNPNAPGFGDGRATIVEVRLVDQHGTTKFATQGGERVRLEIIARAHATLEQPIIGFFLRNRLGQNVFGDNTYLTNQASELSCKEGQQIRAIFEFVMPFLPKGDYAFSVAIASGSNLEHVQHQWLHDALMIKSLSSHVHADILGVPMAAIDLTLREPELDT